MSGGGDTNPIVAKILEVVAKELEEVGAKNPTEYIAIMDSLVWELRERSIACRTTQQNKLSEKVRDDIIDALAGACDNSDYGAGHLYVDGANIIGFNDMTDEELVMEYCGSVDESDELYVKACGELAVHNLLTSEVLKDG